MRHVLILLACLAGLHAHADPLVLLTEEYPPFNMSSAKGEMTGISTEVVRALMHDARLEYSITVSPWMRAVTQARTLPNHCVFSMSRLADREKDFTWVGPLAFNDWFLFAKSPPARVLHSLADAKGARIGSYFGDGGVAYLQKRGFEVDVAPSDDLNPRKLKLGRIDYWASGKLSGQYLLKSQHIDGIEPVLKMERGDMYLACHPATAPALVARLNALLAAMHRHGVIARIYASYGYAP
jgi:polar amino acid transport system substrate-binding protein